jgi:hypothetical protein
MEFDFFIRPDGGFAEADNGFSQAHAALEARALLL